MKHLTHFFTAIILFAISTQALSSDPNYDGEGPLFESGADMVEFLEEAPVDDVVELMDYLDMPLECVEDIVENYEELMQEAQMEVALEALEDYNQSQGVCNSTCTPP